MKRDAFAGCLVLFAVYAYFTLQSMYTRSHGDGRLHVVTVGVGPAELLVDNQPVPYSRQSYDHFTFPMKQGRHEVKVTDKGTGTSATYTVNVETGFTELLLPVRRDQCFARFDMSVAYEFTSPVLDAILPSDQKERKPQAVRPLPTDSLYENKGVPINVPPDTYFTRFELPQEKESSKGVYLLRDVPCSTMADTRIRDRLGLMLLSSDADRLFTPENGSTGTQQGAALGTSP